MRLGLIFIRQFIAIHYYRSPLDSDLLSRRCSLSIRSSLTAVVDEASFAFQLDKAVERSNQIKNGQVIVNGTKLIEAKLVGPTKLQRL